MAGGDGESSVRKIVIGSRSSELAMIQATYVKGLLEKACPDREVVIVTELASGDVKLDKPLAELARGNPGLFTKELEIALLAKRVDVVVHSLKDMPTATPPGLSLAAITERANPEDVLVLKPSLVKEGCCGLGDLAAGSVVGTSSLRRAAFIRRKFPDLVVTSVRGNLNTRFAKLDEGRPVDGEGGSKDGYAALVLARAGVERMGWEKRISSVLAAEDGYPYGVGQGALGIECRSDDDDLIALLREATEHCPTAVRCAAERAFLRGLQGGCQVPVGVHSQYTQSSHHLTLYGSVCSLDGTEMISDTIEAEIPIPSSAPRASGSPSPQQHPDGTLTEGVAPPKYLQLAVDAGKQLAKKLIESGADRILGPIREPRPLTYGKAE